MTLPCTLVPTSPSLLDLEKILIYVTVIEIPFDSMTSQGYHKYLLLLLLTMIRRCWLWELRSSVVVLFCFSCGCGQSFSTTENHPRKNSRLFCRHLRNLAGCLYSVQSISSYAHGLSSPVESPRCCAQPKSKRRGRGGGECSC